MKAQLDTSKYALLKEIAERGEPQGVEDLLGFAYIDKDQITRYVNVPETLRWLWINDFLEITSSGSPFIYNVTEKGKMALAGVKAGGAIDKQRASLDTLAREHGEMIVIEDPGKTKRSLAVPYITEGSEELDYPNARWVYSTGAVRAALPSDVDRLVKKEEPNAA